MLRACPNSCQPLYAPRRNAKVRAGADQHFFQASHILHSSQRLPLAIRRSKTAQVKDGITDQLSRTVEGYIASAIALENLNAAFRKLFGRGNHVGSFRVPSERDDRCMLE